MNLGLDMDDTITKAPEFFRFLAGIVRADGGQVHIVSSRSPLPDVLSATKAELERLGIEHNSIHLLPDASAAAVLCPHKNLDSYQRQMWLKVDYCLSHGISVYFDDDARVIDLFRRFAPRVQVFQVW